MPKKSVQRFYSVDPLADHPRQIGMSPYSAMWNNPIRYTDPDGRCPECEENLKDPTDGQSYTSAGGAEYTFENGEWTRQGGMLGEITVSPSSGRDVGAKGGGDWHPPMSSEAIGFVDLGYNLTLDQFPNALNGFKYFGTGLSFMSTSLTGYEVYNQHQNGGMSNIDPFQAAGFAVGSTALSSKALSWFGFGGKLAPVIGRFSGIASLGISSIEQWFNFYKSMDNLRFAPSYIDDNGNPYYGDPVPEHIYWGGEW